MATPKEALDFEARWAKKVAIATLLGVGLLIASGFAVSSLGGGGEAGDATGHLGPQPDLPVELPRQVSAAPPGFRGDLGDADKLIGEAHNLGLKFIVDLVPNHTSSEHAWFQAALAAAPGSPERERYIFRDGRGESGEQPPNSWKSVSTSRCLRSAGRSPDGGVKLARMALTGAV